ncbi:hypothetical protein [Dictyobacter formicarum]|uniref:hypothetical protein n=1 Tax=Dictyobacter formicarum TaxID=2778368 RepID=UPI001915AEDA|nr:hypothetical protein [Dictyobacter formicarum]
MGGHAVDDAALRPVLQVCALAHARIAVDGSGQLAAVGFDTGQVVESGAGVVLQPGGAACDGAPCGGSDGRIALPAVAGGRIAALVQGVAVAEDEPVERAVPVGRQAGPIRDGGEGTAAQAAPAAAAIE